MYNKIIYLSPFHYSFCLPFFFSVFVCFLAFFLFFIVFVALLFYLLFLLSLTLIIDIFYRLNYNSLLLHLITANLASHLSLSSILFIISALIIGIFYCLNYTSLLLYLFITHLAIDFLITM